MVEEEAVRWFRGGRWKSLPSGRDRVETAEVDFGLLLLGSGSDLIRRRWICSREKSVKGEERRERRGVDKTTP